MPDGPYPILSCGHEALCFAGLLFLLLWPEQWQFLPHYLSCLPLALPAFGVPGLHMSCIAGFPYYSQRSQVVAVPRAASELLGATCWTFQLSVLRNSNPMS